VNKLLHSFLQEWELKYPDLECLTCFRMSKIRVKQGADTIYQGNCFERDKLRDIAPGYLDALAELEGIDDV
jgi:hypothetical protein